MVKVVTADLKKPDDKREHHAICHDGVRIDFTAEAHKKIFDIKNYIFIAWYLMQNAESEDALRNSNLSNSILLVFPAKYTGKL